MSTGWSTIVSSASIRLRVNASVDLWGKSNKMSYQWIEHWQVLKLKAVEIWSEMRFISKE
jgi:hypothetical protein